MTKREQAEQDVAEAEQLAARAQMAALQAAANVERKRGYLEGVIACEAQPEPAPSPVTGHEGAVEG
jgi:hypothetical protein